MLFAPKNQTRQKKRSKKEIHIKQYPNSVLTIEKKKGKFLSSELLLRFSKKRTPFL